MIKPQLSLPLNSVLTVHIECDQQMLDDDFDQPISTIVVNVTDPISSIFESIGLRKTNVKLIYNNQILCTALSFSFYKVHNNDTIFIVRSQESSKTSLVSQEETNSVFHLKSPSPKLNKKIPISHCSSADIFQKRKRSILAVISMGENEDSECQNDEMNHQSKIHDTKMEFDRLTDIYRFRIESNTKSFRKLCTKYRALVNSESGYLSRKHTTPLEDVGNTSNKRLKGISSVETVLPEKQSFPSTDFLPAFS